MTSIEITHRPTADADTDDCLDHLRVPGVGSMLALVPGPDGAPVIAFDPHDEAFKRGRFTLAEAGAFSAALDDLRAQGARL